MRIAKRLAALGVALSAAGTLALPASAEGTAHQTVVAISHDLGVAPPQFVACFRGTAAAVAGTEPGAARAQARQAAMLPCLQKVNAAITAERLGAVIDRYRAQQPAPVTGG